MDSIEDENPPEILDSEGPVVRGPTVLLEDAGRVTVIWVVIRIVVSVPIIPLADELVFAECGGDVFDKVYGAVPLGYIEYPVPVGPSEQVVLV